MFLKLIFQEEKKVTFHFAGLPKSKSDHSISLCTCILIVAITRDMHECVCSKYPRQDKTGSDECAVSALEWFGSSLTATVWSGMLSSRVSFDLKLAALIRHTYIFHLVHAGTPDFAWANCNVPRRAVIVDRWRCVPPTCPQKHLFLFYNYVTVDILITVIKLATEQHIFKAMLGSSLL